MKLPNFITVAVALSTIVGCGTGRSPQFIVSDDTDSLVKPARDAVEEELLSGFGTPADLVVWPELNVDFGLYTGSVKGKVLNTPGALIVSGLSSSHGEATYEQLTGILGAAVMVPSGDATCRVQTIEPVEGSSSEYRVQISDENGVAADPGIDDGGEIRIVGDGLQKGRSLYSRHCMHCHGSSGDGNPTAKYFNVRPRDYRKGIYKFTSTKSSVLASRDDLYRIVKLGAPGTYMPSFMLLPDDEVVALVEYIRWLSMRGQYEGKLTASLKTDFPKTRLEEESSADVAKEFDDYWASTGPDDIEFATSSIKEDWTLPEDPASVVRPATGRPEATPESIARGRAIFIGVKAKCASCHGEAARGDGPSTEIVNELPGQPGVKGEKPGLYDVWGNIVKPRDLTLGIYRGGRRPIDIYRRISEGIKGTPMQAFGTTFNEEEIWDVVNYVLSVPFDGK